MRRVGVFGGPERASIERHVPFATQQREPEHQRWTRFFPRTSYNFNNVKKHALISFWWIPVVVCGGAVVSATACATGSDPSTQSTGFTGDGGNASLDGTSDACVPTGPEVCDGVDNDCNGKVDEGFDKDGDGYFECKQANAPLDCNDMDPTIHPGANELCNGVDDNCDGQIDEGFDKDGDHFYECAHPEPDGGSLAVDCDDADPTVYPGAKEVCDGKDNDCDGKIDDIPATPTTSDNFQPSPNPHWLVFGNADINVTQPGWARLTPSITNLVGGIFWNTTKGDYVFDHFEMDATVRIIPTTNAGADGMAFVWVPESITDGGAPGLGASGNGYGLRGLGGYGVALDTFANDATEPTQPFVAVVDGTTGTHLIRSTKPLTTINDKNPHTFSVKVENMLPGDGGAVQGVVTVVVDGGVFIDHFVIPGYVPFSGKWGFTAGTGGFFEEHWVTNITMGFPDSQGCTQ